MGGHGVHKKALGHLGEGHEHQMVVELDHQALYLLGRTAAALDRHMAAPAYHGAAPDPTAPLPTAVGPLSHGHHHGQGGADLAPHAGASAAYSGLEACQEHRDRDPRYQIHGGNREDAVLSAPSCGHDRDPAACGGYLHTPDQSSSAGHDPDPCRDHLRRGWRDGWESVRDRLRDMTRGEGTLSACQWKHSLKDACCCHASCQETSPKGYGAPCCMNGVEILAPPHVYVHLLDVRYDF